MHEWPRDNPCNNRWPCIGDAWVTERQSMLSFQGPFVMYPLSCSYRWHINGRCTWHYWRKMCEIDVKNVWKISHIISHEKQVKNMWNLHVKNMWTCEVLFTWWKHVKYMWNNERAKCVHNMWKPCENNNTCETFMWKPCELMRIVSHGTNMWNTSCEKHVKIPTHVKHSCENHVNW